MIISLWMVNSVFAFPDAVFPTRGLTVLFRISKLAHLTKSNFNEGYKKHIDLFSSYTDYSRKPSLKISIRRLDYILSRKIRSLKESFSIMFIYIHSCDVQFLLFKPPIDSIQSFQSFKTLV